MADVSTHRLKMQARRQNKIREELTAAQRSNRPTVPSSSDLKLEERLALVITSTITSESRTDAEEDVTQRSPPMNNAVKMTSVRVSFVGCISPEAPIPSVAATSH